MSEKLYTQLCSEKTLQSDTNGFFLDFAKHVTKTVGTGWLKNKFTNLKSDYDRLKIVYEDSQINNEVFPVLQNVSCLYRKKNASVSRERRLQGENMLLEDPRKALALLSQAVLRAPPTGVDLSIDGGITLPLALWSRSQALLELNEPELSLVDLQISLKEGLPGKHKAELYWRMGKCYKQMNEPNKAKISFNLADKLLGDNNQRKKQLKKDIEKNPIELKKGINKCLPELKIQNPLLPSSSDCLTVANNPKQGRYMVAAKEISAGDVLVVEECYSGCLMTEFYGSHCHHCFTRLVSSYGCPECAAVAFCSPTCRDAATGSYHRYECKVIDVLIGSGMSTLSHVALRMVTQYDLNKMLEIYENRMSYPVYELCTLADKRSPEDFLHRTLMAVFLLRCLQNGGYFGKRDCDNVEPTQQEIKIGELILQHLQILQFNAHEISEVRHGSENRLKGTKLVNVAVGLFKTASFFNHECYSAVARYFLGRNIVIKASRPLKKGEIVSENYGPIFSRMPLNERQKALQSRYWFKCDCPACKEDWPLLKQIDEETVKLKCPTKNCKGIFILPEINLSCNKCKKEIELNDSLVKLTESENLYTQGFDAVENQHTTQATDLFCKGLNIFHKIAVMPHKETLSVQDALRKCFSDEGNTYETLTKK